MSSVEFVNDLLQSYPRPKNVVEWHIEAPLAKGKKYCAVVLFAGERIPKRINFGAAGMEDYTTHRDDVRLGKFLSRFRQQIERTGDNPRSPMFYSYHLLWSKEILRV